MRTFLIFTFALLIALPTYAQDYKTLLDLPEGATLINVAATERVEVEQDLLIATLRYEAENESAKELQNDVNALMSKALDMAKKVSSIKAATQQYNVYQYDRSRGKGARRDYVWKGQQGLQIKGKKADDLLELVGDLQEMGLAMNGLSYTVSPELLEDTRNNMLEAALTKLRAKADRTAKALGKKKTEFLQVNIDHGGYQPPIMRHARMEMATMSADAMSAPVAAPGESQITLSVSAQALIK